MKYVDEFRDRRLIKAVARKIRAAAQGDRVYRFMEVCGTHTMAIFRFGLKDLLPENINLISGPGCPVCVTPNSFLDKAIALANTNGVIIATFGDMLKIPGSYSSLEKEKANGSSVRIVYSSIDALELARRNPAKEIVFLGVGFETTAPTVAQSIIIAKKEKVKNYSVLCGHKTMPEVLEALVHNKDIAVDGFLLPGHVSTIIGSHPYGFLPKKYGKRCVIVGFEPLDILQAILMLVRQKIPKIEIQYTRVARSSGNARAREAIDTIFEKTSSAWRGLGTVGKSGLKIKSIFSDFDAEKKFRIIIRPPHENKACICGDVLRGAKTPLDCKLFARACTPEHPIGACMVSSEGTCAAYYRYKENR